MKDKSKVLKTYGYMRAKLQFTISPPAPPSSPCGTSLKQI